MARVAGIGSILGGIGEVTPETLAAIQGQEAIEEAKVRDKLTEQYRQSQLGLMGARVQAELAKAGTDRERLDIERQKLNQPMQVYHGGALVDRTTGKPIYVAPTPPVKPTSFELTQEQRKSAAAIVNGPGTPQQKYDKLIAAGISATDAHNYLKPVGVEGAATGKPTYEQGLIVDALRTKLGREPTKQEILDAIYNQKTVQYGTAFTSWPETDKEFAFKTKYLTGKDPRFAWGDRRSYNDFQREYYHWANSQSLSPIGAIADQADAHSLTLALNDITKRQGLTNIFIDRIHANAALVDEMERKYGKNNFGRLLNQAQALIISKTTGSGDLESVRLLLVSISNEVAKVEQGSVGVAGATVSQMDIMEKIHDPYLNIEDIRKVVDASIKLGETSKSALETSRNDVMRRIRAITPTVSPAARMLPGVEPEGERIPIDRLPDPSTLEEGQTGGPRSNPLKYIIRNRKWEVNHPQAGR